jgi:hypothetical protein
METCNICGGSRWTDALKEYNAGKMWCVPRKGTPEHAEVKLIMERLKNPKPKRKLKPKTGQASQKRIEEFTPIQSVRSMEEKPKRKLKPRVPEKTTKTCPICNKEFINLEEHITKAHNTLVFQIHKDGANSNIKAFQDGELIGEKEGFGENKIGTLFWSQRQDGEIAGWYDYVKDEFKVTISKEAEPKKLKSGMVKYYKPTITPLHKGYKVEYV